MAAAGGNGNGHGATPSKERPPGAASEDGAAAVVRCDSVGTAAGCNGYDEQEVVYERLPLDIANRYVLLLDPVLGTGHSATSAIQVGRPPAPRPACGGRVAGGRAAGHTARKGGLHGSEGVGAHHLVVDARRQGANAFHVARLLGLWEGGIGWGGVVGATATRSPRCV